MRRILLPAKRRRTHFYSYWEMRAPSWVAMLLLGLLVPERTGTAQTVAPIDPMAWTVQCGAATAPPVNAVAGLDEPGPYEFLRRGESGASR